MAAVQRPISDSYLPSWDSIAKSTGEWFSAISNYTDMKAGSPTILKAFNQLGKVWTYENWPISKDSFGEKIVALHSRFGDALGVMCVPKAINDISSIAANLLLRGHIVEKEGGSVTRTLAEAVSDVCRAFVFFAPVYQLSVVAKGADVIYHGNDLTRDFSTLKTHLIGGVIGGKDQLKLETEEAWQKFFSVIKNIATVALAALAFLALTMDIVVLSYSMGIALGTASVGSALISGVLKEHIKEKRNHKATPDLMDDVIAKEIATREEDTVANPEET